MTLYFQQQGQGKATVILHGLFGSSDNWRNIATALADYSHVYSLDLPNHGQSAHCDDMHYSAMAATVHHWMQEHEIESAHVIGHSVGGKLAMTLARDYPQSVERLVVVDIAPKRYPNRHQAIFDALLALDLSAIENRRQADEILSKTIPDKAIRQFLLMNLVVDGNRLHWRFNLSGLNAAYEDLMADITLPTVQTLPTLFVKGEQSDYIDADDISMIQTHYTDSQIKTVEQAGHWVHAETPKAFISLVSSFLYHD